MTSGSRRTRTHNDMRAHTRELPHLANQSARQPASQSASQPAAQNRSGIKKLVTEHLLVLIEQVGFGGFGLQS